MNFGIIGTNWITGAFIEGTRVNNNMKLAAVYSRTMDKAKEFGTQYGCDLLFDDAEAMAKSDVIDAVYIASPNLFHYEQSKLFLENGKHVICEKPIATSVAEYTEMVELADREGLIYLEAYMMLHHPGLDKIKEAIGKLGKITQARFDLGQFSSKYDLLVGGKNPNIFNPELKTGAMMDMGIYCIYPAIEWFGDPEEVYAKALRVSTGSDGVVSGILAYPDKLVDFTTSKLGQSHIGSEITGDKGTLTIDFIVFMTGVYLYDRQGNKQQVVEDITRTELMGAEADDFYRYATDFQASEKEYRHMQDVALRVCKTVEKINALIR